MLISELIFVIMFLAKALNTIKFRNPPENFTKGQVTLGQVK